MPRDEFPTRTKQRLALRAGYKCSMCERITTGPSEEGLDAVNITGIGAHICAASPGGRRYDPNQTPEERSSIENGIWLCSNHADLIDGDSVEFTKEKLHSIKKQHEEKIKLQQQGLNVEQGTITAIEVCNLGVISAPLKLTFGKRNIILSPNGIGKTLICEFIAALGKKKYLKRWKKHEWDKSDGYCNIYFYRQDISKFTISIPHDNNISFALDDVEVPFLDSPCAIFYPNEELHKFINVRKQKAEELNKDLHENDIVYWIAKYFGLNKKQFETVIRTMKVSRKFFVSGLRTSENQTELEVMYGFRQRNDYHSFGSFSGGEKQRILLEICIQISLFYSKFRPTILLLENTSFGTIDIAGLNQILKILKEEEFPFQVIFTSMEKKEKLDTSGFMVWELDGSKTTGVTATVSDETY